MLTDYMYKHALGLNNLFEELRTIQGNSEKGNFPPHRILDCEGKTYYLSFALAGYYPDEVKVELKNATTLVISSEGAFHFNDYTCEGSDHREWNVTYDGFGTRAFKKEFKISSHMTVTEAKFKDGILQITLEHNLPEEKKSKKIKIDYDKDTGCGTINKHFKYD